MDIGIAPAPNHTPHTPEERYAELDAPVLLSGVQALVRLLFEQARRDRAAGHHTAGLVSGYRGSPLGGLDLELWRRKALLDAADIKFQPGLNEDLGATMLWGAQQIDAFPGKRFDGVFGMWYGKGPGVDRTGDAFRCANMMGTSALGGVLAVAGDDHGAHSSVFPHQTDHVFEGAMIPILAPAHVQDILDFGLAGIALSRYCGNWAALKVTAETVEQAATVTVASARRFAEPDHPRPPHGFNYDVDLAFPRDRVELERRMLLERLPAVAAWARANGIDRIIHGGSDAELGIITVGKAHMDTVHALNRLGLSADPRIAIYKIGLTWPVEQDGVRAFARGKRALLVVEEKRSFVELQVRDALYNMPADGRPPLSGKTDVSGAPLLPALMELTPELVMAALARVGRPLGIEIEDIAVLPAIARPDGLLARGPAFCAGCPHSTSTTLPEGSHATAGIGCHVMALGESDMTRTFSQMGGEGVGWVGMAPFTDTPHMFVNLGDGTYTHSGSLAIRQAMAAKARVTYKILYNDAVAMTGGQPAEGGFDVVTMAAQVAAEGVGRIAIVADDVSRLPGAKLLPAGATRHGRDDLDRVMRDLRQYPGVSVMIYDQVCATEKRRRRKRGKLAAAERSPIINEDVCENCGDCSTQSGCIAIEPVETPLGRKRRINPTSCNVDLSCLKGFCPSFVTVAGPPQAPRAEHGWEQRETELAAGLAEPDAASVSMPWRGLFAGIGGGGIVTAAAIVAHAASLEGSAVSTLDFTGLAQKNGAVVSHVQIGHAGDLDVVRIPLAEADMMLAADLAVAAGAGVLERCRPGTAVVGNMDLAATAAFKKDPWQRIDAGLHRRAIDATTGGNDGAYLRAQSLAETLFGQSQAMNTLMLGLAWQRGHVPVGHAALMQAMEFNGAAVGMNKRAFLWGRILAVRPELADEVLAGETHAPPPEALADLIEQRAGHLAAYQNQAYAALYRHRVEAAAQAETAAIGRAGRFARAAAEGWFRAMSPKDEYEVARLHALARYAPGAKPVFHMAPPLVTRTDPATGRRRKIGVPGWLAIPLFRVLQHGRTLRGTRLDLFARQADRRMERALLDQYASDMDNLRLRPDALDHAVELAGLPDRVRGYGPVKEAQFRAAQLRRDALLAALEMPQTAAAA